MTPKKMGMAKSLMSRFWRFMKKIIKIVGSAILHGKVSFIFGKRSIFIINKNWP